MGGQKPSTGARGPPAGEVELQTGLEGGPRSLDREAPGQACLRPRGGWGGDMKTAEGGVMKSRGAVPAEEKTYEDLSGKFHRWGAGGLWPVWPRVGIKLSVRPSVLLCLLGAV